MKKTTIWTCVLSVGLLFAGISNAQMMEAIHAVNFESTSRASAAMEELFEDEAVAGGRATLYVGDFGDMNSSHIVVVDADSYEKHMERNQRRVASHGWARYLLATADSEYVSGTLASVLADHGAPRHTAGYLVAFSIHTTNAGGYAAAIAELDDAIGNPGVLRLVALRSGGADATHAVLIGGDNFAEVAEYLDMMVQSDAFGEFVAEVGDYRKVVSVNWYRRIGTWGD